MKRMKGYLNIVNSEGIAVFQGLIQDLPLKEEYILKKSLELFQEKEPCIIYRTHIMKKFYLELYDFLCQMEGEIPQSPEVEGFFENVDVDITHSVLHFEH